MTTPLNPISQVSSGPQSCLSRRQWLKSMLAGLCGWSTFHHSSSLFAADVGWLAKVQQPPKKIPRDNVGYLEPLLLDGEGRTIRTVAAWEKQRERLRTRWMEFLGPMPEKRPKIELKILSEDRPESCVRQLVQYESEPGLPVQGYLLRPTSKPKNGKRAGVVALHQTSWHSIDEIAGLKGSEIQHLGLKLARRGFTVFCPRCYLWQDVSSYREAVANFRKRHPQTLGMHKMLYDASRGIDVLESLPDVDANRIGATGHSLGGKETLYLAAFDTRIKAAVASEGGTGFRSTNWDAPWYLGPGINKLGFKLNHHQLLALSAPRPFLILAGENTSPSASDGDRSWPYIEAALPVYELYGKPPRLGMYNHRKGHTIPARAFDYLVEWLKTYLSA